MWFGWENWGHVKEFKFAFRYNYTDGFVYAHLYESESGKRKFKVGSTHLDVSEKYMRQAVMHSELYHERIVRWLGGRHDSEIPKFSERGQDDTFNALRGTRR